MRRSVKAALYQGNRKAEKSLAQYSLRRKSEFENASRYMSIPEELKGFMLEELSGLSKQALRGLRALTWGKSDYDSLRRALHVMDVEEEVMC